MPNSPSFLELFARHLGEEPFSEMKVEKPAEPITSKLPVSTPTISERQTLLKSLMKHIADNMHAPEFPLKVHPDSGFVFSDKPFDHQDFGTLVKTILSSALLFPGSVASTIIPEKGAGSLFRSAAANPRMMFNGSPTLLPYNLFAVENAVKFGKKMGGEEADFYEKMKGALAGACYESFFGNGFDVLSLRTSFMTLRAKHEIEKNPELLRHIPEYASSTKEDLVKHSKTFSPSQQQLQTIGKISPVVNISTGRFLGMVSASMPASVTRNFCFYSLLFHSANNKDQTMAEHAAASLVAATFSSIPKAWISESAASSFVRDKGVVDAIAEGGRSAFSRAWRDPRTFAILVGIRAVVTGLNSLCFSDGNVALIEKNVRALFPDLHDIKLDKKEEKEIDKLATEMVEGGKMNFEEARKEWSDLIGGVKVPKSKFILRDEDAAKALGEKGKSAAEK